VTNFHVYPQYIVLRNSKYVASQDTPADKELYKVRRTALYRVLLPFVIMLLLCACTKVPSGIQEQQTNDVVGKHEKTTLRFISSWGGVDSKAEALKSILDKFEANNADITVINESLFGEDFLPKIKTDFASGNDPDVFGLWPGSDIRTLIDAGKVADLTGLLMDNPDWKRSFNPGMWDYTTYNARIYGLPVEVMFECMFINKDLFERYNVPTPSSFEDLKAAVAIFKENGIVPIAFNTYSEGTYLYQNLIAMIGGKNDTEFPFKDGQIKPSHLTALQYIKELYDIGAFPENCFTMTNNERNILFKEKKAAMIVQGSWFIGEFDVDDYTVDIIRFPYVDGYDNYKGAMVYGLGGGSFHLSTAAAEDEARYEAAVRLLKELTSAETAAYYATETGMISNVNIDSYNIEYRRMTIKGKRMIRESDMLVGPLDSFVDRSSWEEDIAKQFPYFLSGTITEEELWANAIENGIISD